MTPQEFAQLMKTNQQLAIGPHGDQAHDLLQPAKPAYTMTSNKAPTEHEEQVALFQWAEGSGIEALELFFHIPNGGHRHPAVGAKLKAQGTKAGVPDLFLAVPRQVREDGELVWKHGLFIELKRAGNEGRLSPSQGDWIARLREQGYAVAVCHGCEEAIAAILEYLGMEA